MWGCWSFCVIATVLVLSLVFSSALHSMNDHMRPGQLWSGLFAFRVLHIKYLFIIKVLKVVIKFSQGQGYKTNKQKTPKKRQLTRWLKFWCQNWCVTLIYIEIIWFQCNQQKAPMTLLKTLEQGWPEHREADTCEYCSKGQISMHLCMICLLLPGHFPTVLGALIKAVNHKSLRHMSMKPLRCHWG